MSGRQYDGKLLTHEEFVAGKPGVYRVDKIPVKGSKIVNCTNFFFRVIPWHVARCTTMVEVPAGEYIVVHKRAPFTVSGNARASGITISDPGCDLITSAMYGPYVYRKDRLNTPDSFMTKCTDSEFFDIQSNLRCGMHFTIDQWE